MRGGCCPFKKSKPVVWPVGQPYGKGYQEYPSCPSFTKKANLFETKNGNLLSGPTGRDTRKGLKKMVDKKKIFFCLHFLLCPFKKIFFLSTIVALCATMVRSSGSNNCSIRRIEPWTGRDNRFKVFQSKTYLSFKKYGQKGTLGQVRKLVSLPFHPFSSLFFLKKKKGRKRQKKAGKGYQVRKLF